VLPKIQFSKVNRVDSTHKVSIPPTACLSTHTSPSRVMAYSKAVMVLSNVHPWHPFSSECAVYPFHASLSPPDAEAEEDKAEAAFRIARESSSNSEGTDRIGLR